MNHYKHRRWKLHMRGTCPLCGESVFKVEDGFGCQSCNTEFDTIGNVVGNLK